MKTKLKLLKESIEYISDLEVRKEVLYQIRPIMQNL